MSAITSIDTTTAAGTSNAASSQLAGNFDTFLKLLTSQLQNQDPMNPMDSNQFTQQLVEYSQVEQQINTNDNLSSLIALGKNASAGSAVSYLGKAVTVSNGNAPLANGEADWNYVMSGTSASTQLSVTDSTGKVVYTGTGETDAGNHTFQWDGKDNNGNQLADGTYTLGVNATGADGSSIQTAIATAGYVSEVDMSGDEPVLMIGPMAVKLSDITSIADLGSN
jgi:flagellar basal-body rod modification protein FlgD